MPSKVEIRMTSHGQGKVTIDGVPWGDVKSISFRASAGEKNEMTLRFLVPEVEIISVEVEAPASRLRTV